MNELFPRREKSVSFPSDYSSVIERVNQIDPIQYSRSRNFIDGAISHLSPYISRGVMSVKQVHDAVWQRGFRGGAAQKFLQELAWREYFQRVWQVKGDAVMTDLNHPQQEVLHRKMIHAIASGTTGITAIDDHIREFFKTGYMHNHVRLYVASIACNVGRSHWSAPAQWMYYHLLDGDLASNNCSWQWVAGSFSSKKYYASQENINCHTYSTQQYTFLDASMDMLIHAAVPDHLKPTCDLALKTILPLVPTPSIDVSKPTFIYNSYNLDPQWRAQEDANRVLLLEPSHFQKYPVSRKVLDFIVSLSHNIPGCQLMVGEVSELRAYYNQTMLGENRLVSKEHPAFHYYPGIRDQRDWIYPEVTGYFNSFSSFWKRCLKLRRS